MQLFYSNNNAINIVTFNSMNIYGNNGLNIKINTFKFKLNILIFKKI